MSIVVEIGLMHCGEEVLAVVSRLSGVVGKYDIRGGGEE